MLILLLLETAQQAAEKAVSAPPEHPLWTLQNVGEVEILAYRFAAFATTMLGLWRWVFYDFIATRAELKTRRRQIQGEAPKNKEEV